MRVCRHIRAAVAIALALWIGTAEVCDDPMKPLTVVCVCLMNNLRLTLLQAGMGLGWTQVWDATATPVSSGWHAMWTHGWLVG